MTPPVVVSQPQQAPEEPSRRVHADAAGRMVGVTTDTIRRWVSLGLLPAERLGPGRRILIDPADLERLISNGSSTLVEIDEVELAAVIDGSVSATTQMPQGPVFPDPARDGTARRGHQGTAS